MSDCSRRLGIVLCILTTFTGVVASPAAAGSRTSRPATAAARAGLIQEINAVRAAHNLSSVRPSKSLTRASTRYTASLVGNSRLVHAQDLTTGSGFIFVGEALGFSRASRPAPGPLVEAWMQSPPHRAVLLNPIYTHVGVGLRRGRFGGGPAWIWVTRLGSNAGPAR
jgi:uncharacterized protein YkwD